MNEIIQQKVNARWKNVVIFIAAMFVGIMSYTGELIYTPLVLMLLLIAVGIGKYGYKQYST
jgi:ABC-type polysaccharide/polyol phosphate export permease